MQLIIIRIYFACPLARLPARSPARQPRLALIKTRSCKAIHVTLIVNMPGARRFDFTGSNQQPGPQVRMTKGAFVLHSLTLSPLRRDDRTQDFNAAGKLAQGRLRLPLYATRGVILPERADCYPN
jgi:hypothetical protein